MKLSFICSEDYMEILYIAFFQEFYSHLASRMGRFKKGGVPDQEAAARILLNDWNTGKVSVSIDMLEGHSLAF